MPDPNNTKSSPDITRRDFLATAAAATLLPQLAAGRASASGVPQAAQTSWMDNWPTVIVGSWDDMPIFRRRVGGASTRQEEYYRREHTEETVRKLKELGRDAGHHSFLQRLRAGGGTTAHRGRHKAGGALPS